VDNDIPYLLWTPGPLSTSRRVREAMMRDYSSWDVDSNSLVNNIRGRLVRLASEQEGSTSVLTQVAVVHCETTTGIRNPVAGMHQRGFRTLLPAELQSPMITAFHDPCPEFDFDTFYDLLKQRRFVVYPGKVSQAQTFRIGTIGHVFPDDIDQLLESVTEVLTQMQIDPFEFAGEVVP
jgi:aspartate aminotransferase-like enzyme